MKEEEEEEETFTPLDNPPRMKGRVGVTFLSTDSQTFISRRRPLGGTTATSLRQVLPPDHSEPLVTFFLRNLET